MKITIHLGTDKRPFKRCYRCGGATTPEIVGRDGNTGMEGGLLKHKFEGRLSLYRYFFSPKLALRCQYCGATGPRIPIFTHGVDMKADADSISLKPSKEWMEEWGKEIWEGDG